MKVLGVIPARGGSKGIPLKNLAPLCGRPLIAHTISAALESRRLSRVVLSTEDERIARAGMELGVEVPFMRPERLASDDALTIDVLIHVTERLEEVGERYDAIFTLQPTNPLRLPEDIDGAICLLNQTGADSVISFTPVGDNHPARMKQIGENGRVFDPPFAEALEGQPRQSLPKYFLREGSVYLTRRDVLVEQRSLKGLDCRAWLVPPAFACNIDTEIDLFIAEQLMTRRHALYA